MLTRTLLLAVLLTTTAIAFAPAAEAEPLCTMAGCVDTCNPTFCLHYPRQVREVCDDLDCPLP